MQSIDKDRRKDVSRTHRSSTISDNCRQSQDWTATPNFDCIPDQVFFSWKPDRNHTPRMYTSLSIQLKGPGSATPFQALNRKQEDLSQLIWPPPHFPTFQAPSVPYPLCHYFWCYLETPYGSLQSFPANGHRLLHLNIGCQKRDNPSINELQCCWFG